MSNVDVEIYGDLLDDNTRCTHYHSSLDIIAIKMKCCGNYYACISCHNEIEKHQTAVWTKDEFEKKAIICGICKTELTIAEYLSCNSKCPNCKSGFNPKCSNHYHYYFEIEKKKINEK
jgi:uncharacterized CHY-type Zn-finger protein